MSYEPGDRILWHPALAGQVVDHKGRTGTVKKLLPGGWLQVLFDGNKHVSGVHVDEVTPA